MIKKLCILFIFIIILLTALLLYCCYLFNNNSKNNYLNFNLSLNDNRADLNVDNNKKYEILADIQNWSSYSLITDKNNKWVGSSDCGNPEFESFKKKVMNGEAKQRFFSGFELIITPNYDNWTNEKFLAFNGDQTAICSAGGRYPLHAYNDKLLWEGVCTTGMLPAEGTEQYNEIIECLKIKKVVDDYFKIND